MRRLRSTLVGVALLALATACGTGSEPSAAGTSQPPRSTRAATPATPPATVGPAGPRPSTPQSAAPRPRSTKVVRATPAPEPVRVTKLLVFVVENHSLDQMSRELPFAFGLGRRYGYATGYHAVAHPSLPNYLAIAGGSTFDVLDDDPPSAHPVRGASVFGQALRLGKTATLYADGMPGSCAVADGGVRYRVKHNPWAYFVDERSACRQHDVALAAFSGDVDGGRLPNAGMVIPDMCHDAHDCDLSVADGFLRQQLGRVLTGPDWRSGRLAVVVTADEDDHRQDNLVLTTVLHPGLHSTSYAGPLSHYSLTRLYDEVLGAPLLGNAASAPSMAKAFGLAVGPGAD